MERQMEIPRYIKEMDDKEFLDCLDDYGNGHHFIHEAANRIRRLIQTLTAIANSDETDLGEYAKFCEEIAKEAIK